MTVPAYRPAESSPASTFSLRQLVRERLALSESPDPHAVVSALLAELPAELVEQAARKGLNEIVLEIARGDHRSRSTGGNRSAKWDSAAEAVAEAILKDLWRETRTVPLAPSICRSSASASETA